MEKDNKQSPKIKIVYRIAEKQNKNDKKKPDWVNNANCLRNAKRCFPNAEFYIFGDRLEESRELAEKYAFKFFETKTHGNAESFLEILNFAIEEFENEDIVYFLEDDYIHREGAEQVLIEGLERATYVSLYDHVDKYGYESNCDVLYTKSSHWRTVKSTTMTFASKVNNLIFNYPTFERYTKGYPIPQDYYIFNELVAKGNLLITPLPGFSTHGESQWMSPVIDWEKQLYPQGILIFPGIGQDVDDIFYDERS